MNAPAAAKTAPPATDAAGTAAIAPTFSIFHPVITFEHREFYERIIGELNGIFPICNQGKCTAVEISENATEQEQITDLMKKVETFSGELLTVTKKLFDQFYQAKDQFCRSIYANTAYNIINLLDRNLLERTCDVRWWALESAFGACLEARDRWSSAAAAFAAGHQGTDAALAAGLAEPVPCLLAADRREALLRALHLAVASADPAVRSLAVTAREAADALLAASRTACERLEDVRASYTLYRDLVLCDRDGVILATGSSGPRAGLVGRRVAGEGWFDRSLATRDGNDYHASDTTRSVVADGTCLVYGTAVRVGGEATGAPIGVLGVFFDFLGETKLILEDYLPKDAQSRPLDGWYSFLADHANQVIASSDDIAWPVGQAARLPRRHRMLDKGERASTYVVVDGAEAALFSARTDGYLDYPGLGWTSHLVLPKSQIFEQSGSGREPALTIEELMRSRVIPDINKETYAKVQDDKESIKLISLNGNVFASKLGKRGVALGPIFDQITKTGDFATSMMEKLLAEMAVGELDLNLKALESFAKQAIDLVDRNLFERAADIRWWATDRVLWTALEKPGADAFEAACRRMKVINANYTMYRNLVLADANGDIVACSKTELRNELRKINVSEHEWFQLGLRTARSTEYAVQDVVHSPLERTRTSSLAYAGGVRRAGAREGEAIGVLGVLFDWDTEAQKILATCLPRDRERKVIPGCAAFYTARNGRIIEITDAAFACGSTPELPEAVIQLAAGGSTTGVLAHGGRRYLVGSSRTKGYREYRGLGWTAHIVRPVD
jgi:hypothetical protein